jgi:hypothetical protein
VKVALLVAARERVWASGGRTAVRALEFAQDVHFQAGVETREAFDTIVDIAAEQQA